MSRLKKQWLVDVNVWLALVDERHVHHRVALAWFAKRDVDTAVCCRVVQLGLLRLLTNPAVMGDAVQSQEQAWSVWDRLAQDERVVFSSDPQYLEIALRRFTRSRQAGHRQWTDAYLAAFAESGELELATFDEGFAAYPDLPVTHLVA